MTLNGRKDITMDNNEMVNAEEMGFTQEDLEVVKNEMEQD